MGDPTAAGLLDGHRVLVTGVLSERSIAFGVASRLQVAGATVLLSSPPSILERTKRTARRLPQACDAIPLDVTEPEQVDAAVADIRDRWGTVDGLVHSIAFAPRSCLGRDFVATPWEDVATAIHISAYSLNVLGHVARELTGPEGTSIVGLDFDARLAWPSYNWMGVAKSTLESVTRYLARDLGPLGIRVNLVAAGPIRSLAARGIPGFSLLESFWGQSAPLGWDAGDRGPVGDACIALLSPLLRATTGEILHVDGGAHAVAIGGQLAAALSKSDGTAVHA